MNLEGGGDQTCAVCNFLRRRCNSQCFFAPYFPATEEQNFQNANKLFGVPNMIRILHVVPPDQRDAAMKSIKYESFVRSWYRVHGCCRVIFYLRERVQETAKELSQVRSQLLAIKQLLGGQRSQTPNFAVENLVPRYRNVNDLDFNGNESQMSGTEYNGNPGSSEPLATVQTQPFFSRNNLRINNGGMGMESGFRGQQETNIVRQDYQGIPYGATNFRQEYQGIPDRAMGYHEPREAYESSDDSDETFEN